MARSPAVLGHRTRPAPAARTAPDTATRTMRPPRPLPPPPGAKVPAGAALPVGVAREARNPLPRSVRRRGELLPLRDERRQQVSPVGHPREHLVRQEAELLRLPALRDLVPCHRGGDGGV